MRPPSTLLEEQMTFRCRPRMLCMPLVTQTFRRRSIPDAMWVPLISVIGVIAIVIFP
jgi:hypothetical protein